MSGDPEISLSMPDALAAPFAYYGSKSALAPWIVENLPDHTAYVEPFAGSAAVLLAKVPSRYEVLNDLDGEVTNFWRVLRDRHDDLVGALQLTPYGRDEYLFCRDHRDVPDPVERARRFFVRANGAFNGSTSTRVGFSASSPRKNGSKSGTFARRIDERLAPVAARLRAVEVENVDALALMQRWNDPRVVLYLDPPYLDSTRVSRGDYETDNGSANFHFRLLEAITETRSRVVLSGYASDMYAEHLTAPAWTRIDRQVFAPTSSAGSASRRIESLWINFPSPPTEKP